MLVFTLGPMLISLVMSFADWDTILPAHWRGGGNYAEAFTKDPRFWKSLVVTGMYTAFSVPIGIAVALALALRLDCPIYVEETVLKSSKLASTVSDKVNNEELRRWLEGLNDEDLGRYKM